MGKKHKISFMKLKKLIFTVFVLFSLNSYSHKDIVIKKKFGNVLVVFQTPFEYEEVNKGLIIGKYTEKMLKQLNYKNRIVLHFKYAQYPYIFSEDTINLKKINLYKTINTDENKIIFTLYDFDFDIQNVLKFIHFNLNNKSNEFYYKDLLKIFNAPNKLVSKIIKEKVYRQYTYDDKNNCSYISYYIKDDKYYITRNNNVIDTINNVRHFGNICNLGYYMDDNKILSVYSPLNEKIVKFKLNYPVNFIYPIKIIYISDKIYIVKITSYLTESIYLYLVNLENSLIRNNIKLLK